MQETNAMTLCNTLYLDDRWHDYDDIPHEFLWSRPTNPAAALWAGVGTSSWLCPAPPATTVTTAPRTPDTREWSDTIRAATVRTGDRWVHITFGYFIQLYIHIHPTTFNFKLQQAGSWSGRRSSWREFDVFHGTGLRTGNDIKQKTIDFILGKDYWRAIPSPIVRIFTNIKFYFRIKYGNFHTF